MSSLFWYVSLAAFSVGITAFAMYKKKHTAEASAFIVFYLFTTCITWIGEFIVLGLFNSYAYKPGVFPDPWAENITGHLLLNSTMWPAAAISMAAFTLGYKWFPLAIVFFMLPEYIFIRLGIYEQHWWKYYMSIINIAVFLIIAKKWFVKMNRQRHGLIRATVFYFVGFVIIHLPIPLLLLFGKQYYSFALLEKIVGNTYRSSTIFIFIYQLIEVFLLVIFVCVLKKWYWKLVPFVIAFVGHSLLVKMGILLFQDGWKLLYSLLIYVICLGIFILLEKHTLKAPTRL